MLDPKPYTNALCLHIRLNNRIANALEALELNKEDAIAIDMPMNVNTVTEYWAIILARCIVVPFPDSFVADEIALRIQLSKAKALFTQVYVSTL